MGIVQKGAKTNLFVMATEGRRLQYVPDFPNGFEQDPCTALKKASQSTWRKIKEKTAEKCGEALQNVQEKPAGPGAKGPKGGAGKKPGPKESDGKPGGKPKKGPSNASAEDEPEASAEEEPSAEPSAEDDDNAGQEPENETEAEKSDEGAGEEDAEMSDQAKLALFCANACSAQANGACAAWDVNTKSLECRMFATVTRLDSKTKAAQNDYVRSCAKAGQATSGPAAKGEKASKRKAKKEGAGGKPEGPKGGKAAAADKKKANQEKRKAKKG